MSLNCEIGGYLELERFSGEPYHKGAIALNCGRACLEYLIELRDIRTIWLPDWMCDSVPNVCKKRGVQIKVYRIGFDMKPVYDFNVGSSEYLYLMDYYGQLCEEDVKEALACSGGRLIVDEAQGFFRMPWPEADTLYTCRKFFGVADGGYLYTKDGARLLRELERDESHCRMGFVLGRFERPAGEFFADYQANERRFDGLSARVMSAITENIMRAIDCESAQAIRERNFRHLHEQLGEKNLFELIIPNGPYMYPLLVQDADGMREKLAAEGIYIPRLWSNVLDEQPMSTVACEYSANILPLPIDQRHDAGDMERLITSLLLLFGSKNFSR